MRRGHCIICACTKQKTVPGRHLLRRRACILNAWVGCLFYVLCLMAVAYAISGGHIRLDAFDTADLHAAKVRGGQLWRAWTALTLHLDGAHLAANLGAGVWFGYLAGSADRCW